jgi:acetyl esterase/lipase/lysophospholipase L1-like esterase
MLRLLFALGFLCLPVFSQNYAADEVVDFKTPESGSPLKLHIYKPTEVSGKKLPCIVFFFGGGWTGGSPKQFYQQSDYFKRRGVIAISAQYRTMNSHKVHPSVCVADAKSAIRWVRKNAEKLGVDPNRIIAGGGSAGGHVAAATGVLEGLEDPKDDLGVSSVPNAMVLFNPVLDTTVKGYGSRKVQGADKTVLSPCHHVRKGIAPTIIFYGTKDTTVPYENAVRFTKLMSEAGNTCKLVSFEGRNHGFFNSSWFRKTNKDDDYAKTMHDSDVFLTELGMLDGEPLQLMPSSTKQLESKETTVIGKIVACVGDSNTQRGYPKILEKQLGTGWKTVNCGIGGATVLDGTMRPYHKMKHYQDALASKADYIIIMLGTNDANPRWWDATRKTAFKGAVAEEFKIRYVELIKNLKAMAGKPQIIMAVPLPIFPAKAKKASRENATDRDENLVNKVIPIIREIAKEQKLPLVDIHKALSESEALSVDGVHFNKAGYTKMSTALSKAIKEIAEKK